MYEIAMTIALMQPCEFRKDCTWWGCSARQAGNAYGHTVKIVTWPNSIIVEVGLWNQLLGSFRVF